MKKTISFIIAFIITLSSFTQDLQRPKLVVGIVIDQMRWDYLYRYYDRYATNGGFKRLLSQGFSCENTMIPYTPSLTACGHTSIYTGSVPAITGITDNIWWDKEQNRSVYCTEDNSVKSIGSTDAAGQMSPRNLLVTTICDELRLATNFRSKVIGIALKDRGAILPAGHSADAAYWYDNATGDWITSSYYMKELPKWVKNFNEQKLVDKYFQQGWNTLYPANTYVQSDEQNKPYTSKPLGAAFPYDLKKFTGKNYDIIDVTPYGNTLTVEFAKAAIVYGELGVDDYTDFLTISFSSPDYIGHTFGPNSIEEEDNYLRLDKELGDLLDFLDTKVGKDQYTLFLAADHGVSHVPGFLKEHNIPTGNFDMTAAANAMNNFMNSKYGISNIVVGSFNYYQFTLNYQAIDSAKLNADEIKKDLIGYLLKQPGVAKAFAPDKLLEIPLNARIKDMFINGYYPKRCGDIQVILDPQWLPGFSNGGTTHGMWNPYDAHIPLLWYGWGIKQGKLNRETYMTDIAPTVAALLHIQMPSGCIGKVIPEVMK